VKQTIYLYADTYGVNRMTKSLGQVRRGEIPIELEVTVEETAFREPVLRRQVVINDWREGVDIADIDFKETFITEEEAAVIRQMRMDKMAEILQAQGYTVSKEGE
jgi:hypothetical protein